MYRPIEPVNLIIPAIDFMLNDGQTFIKKVTKSKVAKLIIVRFIREHVKG